MSTFDSFPLDPRILANLAEMGFTSATDIQTQIMPIALEARDVSGLSRTGTGKTAAFLIPTIQRLLQLPEDKICLCLAPTRELAQQIEQEAKKISKDTGLGTVSVVGGMSSDDQIAALKKGARIVTGTPGRVIDLFKEKALKLQDVEVLVFDEADRMFDMGFIDDMHFILKKVNPKRQILLFSATMNFSVLNMVYEYGANPHEINVSRDVLTAEKIKQVLYHVGDREKAAALLGVCRKYAGENGTIIVFVNYKERVPWVAALLSRNGIPAQGLSSLLRQERRNKIIKGFKEGQFRALVATDVASRGLDVDNISLVVNYHLPEEAATYVHRIGRTARAGRDGIAVAICSSEDAYNQMRVEEFLGDKIPVEWLGEEEVPKDVKIPGRNDEREFSDDDEGAEGGGGEGREARGGRDRGGRDRGGRGGRGDRGGRDRGGRDRGGRGGDRGPRPERVAREGRPPEGDAASAQVSDSMQPAETGNEALPSYAREREGMDDAGNRRHEERGDRGGRDRGPREDRGPRSADDRGPREDRGPRSADDRGPREDRGPRSADDRGPREDRGPRSADDRGPRDDRGRRGRRGRGRDRDRGGRDRDFDGGRSREPMPEPSSLPNPLTGNPVIYDMQTGKPKNRTDAEFRQVMDEYNGRLATNDEKFGAKKSAGPAILKKISSKVTALFGKRDD